MKVLRHLPRFRHAYRALQKLADREQWLRADIEELQLERLNALWQHAVRVVPYYRNLARELRLPDRFNDLTEFTGRVPILSKETVRTRHEEFLAPNHAAGHWHYTGGSTGTPTGVFWATHAHREMLRAKYRFYDMWGVDVLDPIVFLWGHAASFAPGWKGQVAKVRRPFEDRLRNRLRLSAYCLGAEEIRNYLEQIERFRPAAIYAYSSAAYLLAQGALEHGFKCDSLKFVNLTAEPAYPHIVAAVEKAFGVPAINEYGSAECGFVAGEGPDRTIRIREDIALVEAVPSSDGRYDIIQTILTNDAFPLIRYDIGDITDAPIEKPDRGFAMLKNIAGRSNDFLQCRSGRSLHPVWFMTVLDQTGGIRRYQIHQHSGGAVEVDLELQPSASVDVDTLRQRFTQQLEGFPVDVRLVDTVEQTAAGKHRWIRSDMTGLALTSPVVETASGSTVPPTDNDCPSQD